MPLTFRLPASLISSRTTRPSSISLSLFDAAKVRHALDDRGSDWTRRRARHWRRHSGRASSTVRYLLGTFNNILINNAGVIHAFDMTKGFSLERQLQEIAIDAAGPMRRVHHFLPNVLERMSEILNVSSELAYVPYAAAPIYSASNAFLHAYIQCLRAQLAGTSMRVAQLLPPFVDTPMAGELNPSLSRMPPEKLVSIFLKGLRNGKNEITPGQSAQFKWLSRFAPKVFFGQLNKKPRD